MTKESYKKIIDKIGLPDTPGVYVFRDAEKDRIDTKEENLDKKNENKKVENKKIDSKEEGEIAGNVIYIGKATNLRDRTKSYFSPDLKDTRGLKIVNMVLAAENLTYIRTESVLEALLLENTLIKQNQPIFNTKEKDDKSYKCVVITKEEYPRVLIMRTRDYEKRFLTNSGLEKIDKVYGPFTSGTQIIDAMKIVRKIFPYRDRCEVGKNILTDKPCFNAQIKLCPGSCAGLITESEYKNNIKHIKDLFEGKRETIKKDLEKEMKLAAKEERFERAGVIRNTIWALDHIRDVSLIKDNEDIDEQDFGVEVNSKIKNNLKINESSTFRIEAYDVAHISGTSRVGVMTVVIDGKKEVGEYKKFKLIENLNDDYAGIVEMLKRRLKHDEWGMPDIVVIDGGMGQKNIAEKFISQIINTNNPEYDISKIKNIRVVSVVKDDKHKARDILGIESIIGTKVDINKKEKKSEYEILKKSIILVNHEAHRFAIRYHKELRAKI